MSEQRGWLDHDVAGLGHALLAKSRAERAPARTRERALLAAQGALLGSVGIAGAQQVLSALHAPLHGGVKLGLVHLHPGALQTAVTSTSVAPTGAAASASVGAGVGAGSVGMGAGAVGYGAVALAQGAVSSGALSASAVGSGALSASAVGSGALGSGAAASSALGSSALGVAGLGAAGLGAAGSWGIAGAGLTSGATGLGAASLGGASALGTAVVGSSVAGTAVAGTAVSGTGFAGGFAGGALSAGSLLLGAAGAAKATAVALLLAGGVYLGVQTSSADLVAMDGRVDGAMSPKPDLPSSATRAPGSGLAAKVSPEGSAIAMNEGANAALDTVASRSVGAGSLSRDTAPLGATRSGSTGNAVDEAALGTGAEGGQATNHSANPARSSRASSADEAFAASRGDKRTARGSRSSNGARHGEGVVTQVTDEQCVGAQCAQSARIRRDHAQSERSARDAKGNLGAAGKTSNKLAANDRSRADADAVNAAPAVELSAEGEASRRTTELAGRLGQQLQLIQRARRLLRAHDVEKALTTLRMYRELYPDGELLPEANRLSTQAQREMAADE